MILLAQAGFFKVLGWSLIDSVWQMGIFYLLYLAFTTNGKKRTAAQRYNLALISLAGGSISFFTGMIIRIFTGNDSESLITHYTFSGIFSLSELFDPALPYLSAFYLVSLFILIIRFLASLRLSNKLSTKGLHKIHPDFRVFVQQLSGQMGISKKVQIWLSEFVDVPMTIGYLKPVILLPIAAVSQLDTKQVESIILHELEHIRRNDYLLNFFVTTGEMIFFFNPFAVALVAIIRKEREISCDDRVIYFDYESGMYSSALLELEKLRIRRLKTTINAIGNSRKLLLFRVKRMLTGEMVITKPELSLASCCVAFLLTWWIGWKEARIQENYSQPNFANINADAQPKQVVYPSLNDSPEPTPEDENKELPDIQATYTQRVTVAVSVAGEETEPVRPETEPVVFEYVFAGEKEVRNFALQKSNERIDTEGLEGSENYPYVPSNSFHFQLQEDTLMPMLHSQYQLEAKKALLKAVKELEKARQELFDSQSKEQLALLQIELNKSAKDINWKKIESDMMMVQEEMAKNHKIMDELHKFQKSRIIEQEKLNALKEKILLERLNMKERKVVEL